MRHSQLLAVLVVCTMLGSWVFGQPAFDNFEKLWETAKSASLPDGTYIETVSRVHSPTPDEPDRRVEMRHRLWFAGNGLWRYSRDNSADLNGRIPYLDAGHPRDRNEKWMVNPSRLTVVKADTPPETVDPESLFLSVTELWASRCTGLPGNSSFEFSPTRFKATGSAAWVGVLLSRDSTREAEVTGRIVGGKDLLVERVEVFDVSGDRKSLGFATYSDWQESDLSPTGRVAGQYESYDINGKLRHRDDLIALHPTSVDEVEPLAAVPESEGQDRIRGEIPFVSIVDYRVRGVKTTDPQGNKIEVPLAEGGSVGRGVGLRYAGWFAVAAMLAFFVFIRTRKPV